MIKKPVTNPSARSPGSGSFDSYSMTSGLRRGEVELAQLAPLARILGSDIVDGRLPIGTLLPSERELCDAHGLSRYAVREAMTALEAKGLIQKRRGIGTRVISDKVSDHHLYRLDTMADLVAYTRGTEFLIAERGTVTSHPELEDHFNDLPAGSSWLRLGGVRHMLDSDIPISADSGFVRTDYADIPSAEGRLDTNLFVLVQQRYGLRAKHVRQNIKAIILRDDQARLLDAAPGSAGLVVARRFDYDQGTVILTISVYPANKFHYETSFRVSRKTS